MGSVSHEVGGGEGSKDLEGGGDSITSSQPVVFYYCLGRCDYTKELVGCCC